MFLVFLLFLFPTCSTLTFEEAIEECGITDAHEISILDNGTRAIDDRFYESYKSYKYLAEQCEIILPVSSKYQCFLSKTIETGCDIWNFFAGPFYKCIHKFEKYYSAADWHDNSYSSCLNSWEIYKWQGKYSFDCFYCKHFFGGHNCMKWLTIEKCGKESWEQLRDFLAGFDEHCDFTDL
ncbi:unnamed protein product [Caenorhabditis angaria]|uniref:T20D4.11-like domain-containing protein n=1 Tax=Caenorhabditis angaria TaxID=860376 RepID=A0A9P1IN13_9PELO|nr:unnamed protein product [Caenorhabditis angaria]